MPTLSSSSSSSGSSGSSSSSGGSSSSEDESRPRQKTSTKHKRVKRNEKKQSNGRSSDATSTCPEVSNALSVPSSNHHQPSIDARGTIPLSGNEAAVGQVGATNLTPDLTKRQKKKMRMTVSLLKERINAISQDNDVLVNKINGISKLCKLRLAHRKHLMDRLHAHGDNFKDVPILVPNETSKDKQEIRDHHQQLPSQQRAKRPYKKRRHPDSAGTTAPASIAPEEERELNSSNSVNKKVASISKKSRKKDEILAAAAAATEMPKKPHNAYFYFCHEFRLSVVSSLQRNDQDSPPDKREVASVLTAKWNALTFDQKQVYYRIQDEKKKEYESAMKRWQEHNPVLALEGR